MIAILQHLGIWCAWVTPDRGHLNPIYAKVKERYIGCKGQMRVAIVDHLGSLHHFNENQVQVLATYSSGKEKYVWRVTVEEVS